MAKAAKKNKKYATRTVAQPVVDLKPLNDKQATYIKALHNDTITFALGSAGVGKTAIGVMYAAQQLLRSNDTNVVLTRPIVGLGKGLGFLPGTAEEKFEPWLAPMLGEFKDALGANAYECKLKNQQIRYQMLEVVRGNSYDDTIILVDEAQNLSLDELKALSTRVGVNSQIVFMGDTAQYDAKAVSGMSPIEYFCDVLQRHNVRDTSLVRFTRDDIVRSDIVRDLVVAFEEEGI